MNEYKNLKIKDWAVEDRPREKILRKGLSSLSDAELLAILIGSGNKNETAVALAQRILNDAKNNLNELGKKSIAELQNNYMGIGEAKAITIAAALELGRRRSIADIPDRVKIKGSNDVFKLFNAQLSDLPHEEFWTLYLSRSNKVISKKLISKGGISGTVTDIRLIIKEAIELLASGLIVCHNHPSGNMQASEADKQITKRLSEACKLFDIQLLDHLIIGDNQYFSFADESIL